MSERKNMPKMFDYQRRIVENEVAKIIIGNFSRNTGKTYTMACKILYDRPNLVFFVVNSDIGFISLQDKFKEIFTLNKEVYSEIENIIMDKNKIKIIFTNGEIVNIYNYRQFKTDDCIKRKIPDLLLYSDCLPINNIKAKQIISMVTMPIEDITQYFTCQSILVINVGLKDIVENKLIIKGIIDKQRTYNVEMFKQEIDIFNEYEEIFKNEEDDNKYIDWLNKEIDKLQIEFSNIQHKENTTMTREKLLNMIDKMWNMEKNIIR